MYMFSIPDSEGVRPCNKWLFLAMDLHKEWFYEDFVIETAYGSPGGGFIWNGNRANRDGTYTSPMDWERVVLNMYHSQGISYRALFTNSLLEPEHLCDTYGNYVAKKANEYGESVMVSTELMAEYLHNSYPNIKICWSTTTDFGSSMEEQIDKINELSQSSIVVLPYQFNNTDYLKQCRYPGNLEILVNEKCVDNCPCRREHWRYYNQNNLFQVSGEYECKFKHECKFPEFGKHRHIIDRNNLSIYQKMGFYRFKLEGRYNLDALVDAYVDYFVKEGYHEEARMFADEGRNREKAALTIVDRED